MVLMVNRYILPAALEYQKRVADSVAATKLAGVTSKEGGKHLTRLVGLVDRFRALTESLATALDHGSPSAEKHARYMRDKIVPAMGALREVGDQLELVIPHELYPLPTYREMLFVK